MSQSGAASFNSSGAAVVETLTGNNGGAVPPTGFNINTVGTGSITIVGNPGTSTLTTQLQNLTNHSLLVGAGTATITNLGVATNGQLPIGSTGADPTLATLTAGAGISITNGAGSITIAASGSGFAWNDQGTSTVMVAENGYFATAAIALTLPVSPSQGDTVIVDCDTASAVAVTANTGQTIRLGSSTSSVAGTMTSTARGDAMTLTYRASGTTWHCRGVQGNWTPA